MDKKSEDVLSGAAPEASACLPLIGEITDCRQLEELLRLQREILEAIALGTRFGEVLDKLCRLIERMVPDSAASVMLLDRTSGALNVRSAPSLPREAATLLDGLIPIIGAVSGGSASGLGEPVYVADILGDPRWAGVRQAARKLGARACWSVPILSEARAVLGTFVVSSLEPRSPTPFHVRLLQSASYLAGIAIERKQHEQALLESESRLHRITDAVPGAVCQFRLTPKSKPSLTFISRGAEELWGVPIGELRRDNGLLWRMVVAEDKKPTRASLNQAARSGRPWSHEFRLRRPGGDVRWVRMSAARDPSSTEEDLTWNGIILDVTGKKRAERRLAQWAAAFENVSEGVIITGPDHRIQDVNRAFCEITGYRREEIRGQKPSILRSDRQDDAFFGAMRRALTETGRWQGEIWNRRKNGEVYPEWLSISAVSSERGELTNYVGVFADITAIKESENRLAHLAHHDPLTGLPNRLLFGARLEHALQRAQRSPINIGLLFLDLDRFKNVNDSLGHALGDELLAQAAQRLRGCVREQDTVARLGGDEFIVIVEDLSEYRDAGAVAGKLLEALQKPFKLKGHEAVVTASIGISLYPDDGENGDTLLRNADAAMYRAKEQGRNSYAYYTPELTVIVRERFILENNLRRALDREEFRLLFQPQVSAEDGNIVGAEALVRWWNPELGLMTPDRFIPLAEETGLIKAIGEWVLRSACAQARKWQEMGLSPIRLAINLSGQQIMPDCINEELEAILEDTHLQPSNLELEIAESFLVEHPEQAAQALDSLTTLGTSLAIDDFGSGCSSLGYLKRLPVHKLKMDQSLVHEIPSGPNDAALAKSVIALGHSLGLTVIAEGVETEVQRDFLRSEGCDELQGYLYSRPVPAEQFVKMLQKAGGIAA